MEVTLEILLISLSLIIEPQLLTTQATILQQSIPSAGCLPPGCLGSGHLLGSPQPPVLYITILLTF